MSLWYLRMSWFLFLSMRLQENYKNIPQKFTGIFQGTHIFLQDCQIIICPIIFMEIICTYLGKLQCIQTSYTDDMVRLCSFWTLITLSSYILAFGDALVHLNLLHFEYMQVQIYYYIPNQSTFKYYIILPCYALQLEYLWKLTS